MDIKKCIFQQHGDSRGKLATLEVFKEIPFEIKRVYYIYDTLENVRRGFHAHKNLKQVLVCVNGACKLHLDDGVETVEVLLDRPDEGIYLENNIWREIYDFSEDAVLMVFASEYYDESDYIRNYDDFKKFIAHGDM